MKRHMAVWAIFFSALCFNLAYAQHGHGGGGMGGHGMSAGSASMGHGSTGMMSGKSSTSTHSTKPSSSISDKLSDHPKLEAKLQSLLPAGTDLKNASSGFKNSGQFVAAVHVSHNLGIPFDQLKKKMTGPPAESLGKAIHDLKPDADAKAETKKAKDQAKEDEKES